MEEIALQKPICLHYGKCTVIGKIVRLDYKFFLENIPIEAIGKEYRLTSGKITLRLDTSLLDEEIPLHKPCEILGEVILWDTESPYELLPKTSKDLYVEYFTETPNKHEIDLKKLNERYKPMIKVVACNIIDSAADLITHNLLIRQLQIRKSKVEFFDESEDEYWLEVNKK